MTVQLFTILGSPYAWRVQLVLEHKRIPYELRVLSLSSGELKTRDYLGLNPRGKVPTLVDPDRGVVVRESIAIVAYLDRLVPEPPIFGTTAAEAGTIWRVISEYTSYFDPAVEAFILPLYRGTAAQHRERLDAAVSTIADELTHLERSLDTSSYLAGDSVTAADFTVLPHIQSILRAASKEGAAGLDLSFLPLAIRHPALAAWVARMEALPFYASTYPPHWK